MKQEINKNPTILAIDSTTGMCSVSILKNNNILAYLEEKTTSNQAKFLVPMIENALEQSNIGYNDLSSIACTIGAGSFTGIRIGLATARAIGFAAKIPVRGFNTLDVLAFSAFEHGIEDTITAVINAGKGESVFQKFDGKLNTLSPPTLIKSDIAPKPNTPSTYPRADLLAKLAHSFPEKSVPPLPFYIRPPDAKLPSNT